MPRPECSVSSPNALVARRAASPRQSRSCGKRSGSHREAEAHRYRSAGLLLRRRRVAQPGDLELTGAGNELVQQPVPAIRRGLALLTKPLLKTALTERIDGLAGNAKLTGSCQDRGRARPTAMRHMAVLIPDRSPQNLIAECRVTLAERAHHVSRDDVTPDIDLARQAIGSAAAIAGEHTVLDRHVVDDAAALGDLRRFFKGRRQSDARLLRPTTALHLRQRRAVGADL